MDGPLDYNDFGFEVISADDTRITLVIYSSDGQTKVSLQDFCAVLQGWLDEVLKADQMRVTESLENH